MTTTNTYGRQVVVTLTNKSGGGVIAGDVVVVGTANNDAFTTTSSAGFTGTVGVAQETIADNAVGRVLISGYAALINTTASVTRQNFGTTSTTVKKAVDAGASRTVGTFCQFLTGGTTPDAIVYPADIGSGSGSVATDAIWDAAGDLAVGTGANTAARLAIGSAGTHLTSNGTTAAWSSLRSTLGTTSAGASFATARGVYIKKVTMASAGFLMSVHAFVKGNGSNGVNMGVGVLSDNAGAPLSVIAATGMVNVESTSGPLINLGMSTTVRDLAVPVGRWLTAADYWLAVYIHSAADSRIQLAYNSGSGSDRKFTGVTPILSDQSYNSYGASDTNDYCIYADILT